ncbi:hypothetical protein E4K72_21040, partial [Oxalobacteraceae bacterium OM1]
MRYASLSAVVLCSTLAGCGGGGGGGAAGATSSGTVNAAASGTGFTVSLTPASINASFPAEQQALQLPYPPNVDITASVVPSSVSTPVYVYLVDPAGVLVLGKQTITKDSAGHYSAKLLFNQSLPAGTYTGKLQLQICQDAACATPYAVTGGTLPYTITVTPAIAISAKINGVAVASSG